MRVVSRHVLIIDLLQRREDLRYNLTVGWIWARSRRIIDEALRMSTAVRGSLRRAGIGAAIQRGTRAMFSSWTLGIASAVVVGTLLAALLAPLLTPYDPGRAVPLDRLLDFGAPGHVLGTDQLGRDILARLLFGARIAWQVGVSVSALSLVFGMILGSLSFFSSGWLDAVVTRLIDGVLAFPPILLALVLAAVIGPSTRTGIVALAVVYTPLTARIMRSTVLTERSLDYVDVSRGFGNSERWTLWRHVLPNTLGPVIVAATVVVSRSIIVESSLSFLGAGTQPPTAAWGIMIAEGQQLILTNPMLVVVPAIVLSVTVLSINLFADGLADALDVNTRTMQRSGGNTL